MPNQQPSERRRCRWVGASLLVLSLSCQSLSALAQSGSWSPKGYLQHAQAAWALLTLLCGPEIPDRVEGPAGVKACADSYEVTLLWLGMALAWTQLPSNAGSQGQLDIFPAFEPPVMQTLSDLFQAAQPGWEIQANPDMARAPETLRPQLLDATTRSYGIQLRVTIAEATRNDPTLFSLEEGELTEGEGPAAAAESEAPAAPADSTAAPTVPKSN